MTILNRQGSLKISRNEDNSDEDDLQLQNCVLAFCARFLGSSKYVHVKKWKRFAAL